MLTLKLSSILALQLIPFTNFIPKLYIHLDFVGGTLTFQVGTVSVTGPCGCDIYTLKFLLY